MPCIMFKSGIEMKTQPNCFLTTAGEYSGLTEPRACRTISRLRDRDRDDYMLVEIVPPLSGQSFGLGCKDITRLLLSTKLKGTALFPIQEWPAHVYVARVLDDSIFKSLVFTAQQVELIAHGFLYPTLDEAAAVAQMF